MLAKDSDVVNQVTLDQAICSTLSAIAADLAMSGPEPNGRGGFEIRGDDTCLGMLASPRTNEIEWWIETLGKDQLRVRSEMVQEWAGEPIQGYQFNATNVARVVEMVGALGKRALGAILVNKEEALRAFRAADARIIERSLLSLIREAASRAWSERDYAEAKRLYSSIPDLTPLEAKRLDIARREAG